MSNAANTTKSKPVAWVVVDNREGGVHVGESHRTKKAAEGAAWRANTAAGTSTRFDIKPLY